MKRIMGDLHCSCNWPWNCYVGSIGEQDGNASFSNGTLDRPPHARRPPVRPSARTSARRTSARRSPFTHSLLALTRELRGGPIFPVISTTPSIH